MWNFSCYTNAIRGRTKAAIVGPGVRESTWNSELPLSLGDSLTYIALDRQGSKSMFNNIGLPGLLLIAVVVLILFGRGKITSLMGEVGRGITAFKKGVDEGKEEVEDAIEDKAASVARDVTPEEAKAADTKESKDEAKI